MKKVLSLVLVLAMVLGMMPVFAAGETGADQLYKYGFIAGNNGDLMVDKELTRAEMAVLVAEMNGLKEEAANYAAPANFSDVEAGKWYTPYVAYGQANGWWAGYPDGSFKPEIGMSGQEFAAVLMNALKYDFTWNTVVADSAAIGVTVKTTDFTRGAAFDSMWAAVNMPVKGEEVALGVKLGRLESAMTPDNGELAVKSIKATSAKTFAVKFNKAVTDADKITFAVKRLNTAATITTAWNEAKDEAVLSTASNLPEATFDVSVLADTKEVAKESITITAQKVAKIEFTSDSVAVQLTAPNNGYVTYKAFDQYGNDVTTSYLANNMTFTTGAGTASAKNGLVTITPLASTPLLQFSNISIIAYDTTSNVSSTVTLPTSSAVGTLKSFTLGSTEGLSLVEGDVTSTFYLPYTATDMSGNETKNYDLVIGGLIDGDSSASGMNLTVSLSNNVVATIVKDPNDSNKAAIEIKVKNTTSTLAMDMPLSITAMTYSSGTSTVNTTLAKTKAIDTITLLAPAETVAQGETPEIKFEAYDQYGNKITKFSDMNGTKLNLTNLTLVENTDGTAKLEVSSPLVKGTTTLTAAVSGTNKLSTLTLNVQAAQVPSKLVLDTSDITYAMEVGASQDITFDEGEAVKVYDQYDREISSDDIHTLFANGAKYKVNVTATGTAVSTTYFDKDDGAVAGITDDGSYTTVKAGGSEGSSTLTFELYDVTNSKSLSTVQVSLAVIKAVDIVDYTMNPVDKAIYTSIGRTLNVANAARKVDSRYDAELEVFGKTNSGAKVLLASTPVNGAYVSNSDDFVVTTTSGAYDAVRVNAIVPADLAQKSAETVVTVNVLHNDKLTPVTTTIKSSTVKPIAASISTTGTTDDMFSISAADLNGAYLVDYDYTTGASVAKAAKDSVTKDTLRFRISDQYGSRAMQFASFNVVKASTGAAVTDLTVTSNGQITSVTGTSGDNYWITVSTSNGLKATVKVTLR